MRQFFTTAESGLTRAARRWGEEKGRWRRIGRGVWAEGPEDVRELDRARAVVLVTNGVASHHLAGVLTAWTPSALTVSGSRSHLMPAGGGSGSCGASSSRSGF